MDGAVETGHTYICIDLKTFYASVECAERGLDPFTTNLVVADPTRTEKTICLAITPAMKALGIRNRCRDPPGRRIHHRHAAHEALHGGLGGYLRHLPALRLA